MAIAGRVAIVPKGDWSANATYKRLDAVTYNNTLYFAKKNVPAGTETSNAEYWSKSIVGNPDKSSDQQGQNLITYPYYSKSNTINGITWTVNDDGTVTANGTATKESAFNVVNPYGVKARKTLELNQKYVLSDGTSDKAKTYTQFVRFNASTNTYDYAISSRAGYNTWTASDKNLLSYGISLIVANGATVNNVTFKPMLEIGTVSHEYQPTTLSNPTLKEQIGSALQPESIVNNQTTTEEGFALDARQANPNINGTLAKQLNDLRDKVSTSQGQNLINYPYDGTEGDTNGITWTVNEDGSITANGTASKETPYSLIYPYSLSTLKSLQLGYTYTISDGLTDEQHANIAYTQVVRYDKSYPTYYKYGISSMKGTETYTANDENSLRYGIRLIIRNGATADNITFRPMFEIGTVSHEYQPTTLSNPTLKKRIDDIKDVKKVPSIAIENIFTGNPFAVVIDSSGGLASFTGTKWEQDNGGYHVEDIKYPAGAGVSLTVSLILPAHSIVIIDVNTLNYENIKVQGSRIKYNLTDSPSNDSFSIQFTGRNSNITTATIRYMPLVIHLA